MSVVSVVSIRSGISVVSVVSIGISLWLGISRSLSVVSTIGIWVSSVGIWVSTIGRVSGVSESVSVGSVEESSISLGLWLSISGSLSVETTIGIWVSISVASVSKTVSIRSGISVVS